MRAHRPTHAAARRRHCSHVAAIGDVRSAAFLVRLQAIGSNDTAIVFGDENLALTGKPVCERTRFIHVTRQRISLAGPKDGLHDGPNRVLVRGGGGPDQHPRSLPRVLGNTGGFPPTDGGGPASSLRLNCPVFAPRLEKLAREKECSEPPEGIEHRAIGWEAVPFLRE